MWYDYKTYRSQDQCNVGGSLCKYEYKLMYGDEKRYVRRHERSARPCATKAARGVGLINEFFVMTSV